MPNQGKVSDNLTHFLAKNSREEELMHDVLLMIENLTYREEATLKLILDRLYDIGSIHLINKKFRSRPVKRVLKWIARMSKPVFRIFAWRWIKNNCPLLVAKWLYQQVSLKNLYPVRTEVVVQKQLPPGNTILEQENQNREVKFLRSQVKMLTAILIGVITLFGSSVILLTQGLIPGRSQLQTIEQLPPVNMQEASVE